MRIVIDTNCFLAILPKSSRYRPIFDAYRQKKLELVVSTEILLEYAEVFSQQMTAEISDNILSLILKQPNTIKTEIYYRWLLITTDYDDNKFVDTAIAANAEFILTVDKHFNVLKTITFPSIKIIGIDGFLEVLKEML
jgi:putative PIN family toxin of toxin-antitoxin system